MSFISILWWQQSWNRERKISLFETSRDYPFCGLSVVSHGFSHLIGRKTIKIPEIFSGVHGFTGFRLCGHIPFDQKFRNEISKNVSSIRSLTRNFQNFWSNGTCPVKARFLLTDIHQTNVLAFDELECDRNILQFLWSKQRLLVVFWYFLVRKDLQQSYEL